ncbi:MAG: N-acetylmuramoyl-L-alanine amidase [Chromatiales bacterium]|nr:N-acetylmuramoyl-L-alanine amidase [Chromatiales bacterium]
MHGTGGMGTLAWLRSIDPNSGNVAERQRAKAMARGVFLFHDLIERSGRLVNLIDPRRWTYHGAVGHLDSGTIGIELENCLPDNRGPYEPAQYATLVARLCDYWTFYFPETLRTIRSHRLTSWNARRMAGLAPKPCPGPLFDWPLFKERLGEFFTFDEGVAFDHLKNVKLRNSL